MKKRPAHAVDCPACDGWIGNGDTLCVRCSDRVWKAAPEGLNGLIIARQNKCVEMECFWKGYMIGTAKLLNTQQSCQTNRRLTRPHRRWLAEQKGDAS